MSEATGKGPLSAEMLARMNAYWRAANHLSVGQIYLKDNPLLERPLTLDDVKPRLLGHLLHAVMQANKAEKNFRVFGPDETASNRLQDVITVTGKAWMAETLPVDEELSATICLKLRTGAGPRSAPPANSANTCAARLTC